MRVFVTGGTGYIGSHQTVALLEAGHDVHIIDNGSNSVPDQVVERIGRITGTRPTFDVYDVRDTSRLAATLTSFAPDAIIHFAGHKHVRESIEQPIAYARNNLDGLASVLEAATEAEVFRLVFSSSGSVYGDADVLPIPESAPHRPTNPYSMTKSVGERLLRDLCIADNRWFVTTLRYFNPAGSHCSGLLGDAASIGVQNLLPRILDVALGLDSAVEILGDDWPTTDGTAERDYVHVLDVVEAHLRALDLTRGASGFEAINIGRGVGISVMDLVDACRRVTGRAIPVKFTERRAGDVASLYADTSLARTRLGAVCERDLDQICSDAWNFALRSKDPA